jgi:hypothetical protein
MILPLGMLQMLLSPMLNIVGGGAAKTLNYAIKKKRQVINISDKDYH